jgi:hypothetical protein
MLWGVQRSSTVTKLSVAGGLQGACGLPGVSSAGLFCVVHGSSVLPALIEPGASLLQQRPGVALLASAYAHCCVVSTAEC